MTDLCQEKNAQSSCHVSYYDFCVFIYEFHSKMRHASPGKTKIIDKDFKFYNTWLNLYPCSKIQIFQQQ